MVKLYGVPGSRAMRSLWMLEELGVPYENVKVDFVKGTKTPEFRKINPNGHIPVLQDGDLVLCESLAINLYLARKYDKGLWPKSVEDEGRTYQWSVWAMTELEEPLDAALAGRAHLAGDAFTVADLNVASVLSWAPLGGLDLTTAKHAQSWITRCTSRPAFLRVQQLT